MTDVFDFYPCMVDGRPASIYVNLRYEHETPSEDTRYTLAVALRDAGEHAIGTADEAAVLDAFEGEALPVVAARGLVFVGRLRHAGVWELVFYGAAGALDALTVDAAVLDGRRVVTRSDADPAWIYYRELLLPDAERLQWMDDRRMVQILVEQGDVVTRPRRIDHRVSFATEAARAAFVTDAERHGFALETGEDPRVARVHRVDPIELAHVHDVVMVLVDAAAALGGTYEGWTAPIEG